MSLNNKEINELAALITTRERFEQFSRRDLQREDFLRQKMSDSQADRLESYEDFINEVSEDALPTEKGIRKALRGK